MFTSITVKKSNEIFPNLAMNYFEFFEKLVESGYILEYSIKRVFDYDVDYTDQHDLNKNFNLIKGNIKDSGYSISIVPSVKLLRDFRLKYYFCKSYIDLLKSYVPERGIVGGFTHLDLKENFIKFVFMSIEFMKGDFSKLKKFDAENKHSYPKEGDLIFLDKDDDCETSTPIQFNVFEVLKLKDNVYTVKNINFEADEFFKSEHKKETDMIPFDISKNSLNVFFENSHIISR